MNRSARTHTPEPLTRFGTVVLAMIIEQPDHGYEVWRRIEDRFGPVSNSKVYREIRRLLAFGFIERIGDEASAYRQARFPYRATAAGARIHRERIVAELREDHRIVEFRERILSIGRDNPRALLAIIGRLEDACIEASELARGDDTTLRGRLIAELRRTRLNADLAFARRAREMIAEEEP